MVEGTYVGVFEGSKLVGVDDGTFVGIAYGAKLGVVDGTYDGVNSASRMSRH